MAYKYFTKRLLQEGNIDLASVFPEKQRLAKEQTNVSYSLPEIVNYLQTVTEDFKFVDQRYIDIDNAIRAIIARYYTSIGQRNPFEESGEEIIDDEEFQLGNKPKDAAVVSDGKIKNKAEKKPTIAISSSTVSVAPVDDKMATPGELPVEPIISSEDKNLSSSSEVPPTQQEIKDAIEVLRFLVDDGGEEGKNAQEAIEALELLLE